MHCCFSISAVPAAIAVVSLALLRPMIEDVSRKRTKPMITALYIVKLKAFFVRGLFIFFTPENLGGINAV